MDKRLVLSRPINHNARDPPASFSIALREFKVPEKDSNATDLRGEPMYRCPWAIPDPEPVVRALSDFISESVDHCALSLRGPGHITAFLAAEHFLEVSLSLPVLGHGS